MAQQISVEDAFPVFRDRCRELFDENLLLRAQVASLERRLTDAQEENDRLTNEVAADMPGPAAQFPEEGRL